MSDENYENDATIEDDEVLLRRIYPGSGSWIYDQNLGRTRPTSQAFNDHPNGSPMSVHLSSVLAHHGLESKIVLEGHEGFALVSITAGLVRQCNQVIVRKPLAGDPAHAEVIGNKTPGVRKKMARNAVWVFPPPSHGVR